MRPFIILTAAVALSGCNLPMGRFQIDPTGSATSFSVPNVISGNCGASAMQGLLNQSESALTAVTLPANTRIIRPGTAWTADADPGRLNIGINADSTIVHVACG